MRFQGYWWGGVGSLFVKVEVRLFAMLRERAGCDSVTVDVPEGATVRQALDAVGARHGLGELLDAMPVVMAVNRDYATDV